MASNTIINSGNTLSTKTSPGQDFRVRTSNSHSIFTFGDFRLEQSNVSDNIIADTSKSNFSNYANLAQFSSTTFNAQRIINTKENELNPDTANPNSYAYFGSFYTKVATAINNIIKTFPYAILSNNFNTGFTVFNYANDFFSNTSSFRTPISGLTNQGNVVFASGVTFDQNAITLYNNFNQFAIQLSGATSAETEVFNIIGYNYIPGNTGYLEFTIDGQLFSGLTTTSTLPLYIRPTANRMGQYKRSISNIEYQLLYEQVFLVPETDSDTFVNKEFIYPKSIDGFNPDGYGSSFESYVDSILTSAGLVDETKTDWMIRTMIPENYLELDTDDKIYRRLINVYAEQFDTIKEYIDNLAFMHSVNYKGKETVPDKFLYKLSSLLGFKFVNAFNDADIFEYLAIEDSDEKTLSDYNLDLWRRILTNINWLYKKKGTRDALMFLFKIIGAPDCLINFNEFTYKVKKTFEENNPKVNDDGFINYDESQFVFQEGGSGRGDGQNYINQWNPEFGPERQIDNVKVTTGNTIFGTQDIVNTKEVELDLRSSAAIECDVKEWYELGFGTWLWGSTGTTVYPYEPLPFSGLTVPFEWIVDSPNNVAPSAMTAMTIAQWIDYIYASNIRPETRKVEGSGHMSTYISLKKIYITYMLWTNNQNSNRLTFRKLESFLTLLERNFFGYLPQFLPSTTILQTNGVVYKNTVFNRQKFVYPKGINDGSEFKVKLPLSLDKQVIPVVINSKVNDIFENQLNANVVSSSVNDIFKNTLVSTIVKSDVSLGTDLNVDAYKINSTVREAEILNINKQRLFSGNTIIFPTKKTVVVV